MESESKTSDITPNGKWQWKSNSDPWSKTEEPLWTSYSLDQNYLIEKAYFDKQNEVDLGDYVLSLQHLKQHKKGNTALQRPIRRITCEDNETDARSERYFETELPKTINKIFGSLEHFISFFSRRNPEILGFTKQFEEFERLNDLEGLNTKISPQVIACLEEELLKPIDDLLKDKLISKFQKKAQVKRKERHEELILLLMKDFASFEEFYGVILKSYTMNTSLYLNMNKYLRDESWTALDNLLPYAICLCKAFFSFQRSNNSQKETQLQAKENSIILYRGTALDGFALSSYQDKEESKLFSWNSVTSTSRNRKMAERFMYNSVNMEKKKYPVLFIIEIPLTDGTFQSEYLKWIDIHQYSAIPNEDEVILAPGSAFELINLSTDEERRTIIQIKLKHEVGSLARGGLIMQGAFQNEMMSDKQVKIMCLEGEELFEALKNISGNRLIEEIEFCLCIFDKRSLEELLLKLPTLEKARGLKFVSCKYEDKQEISSIKLQNACKILEIEVSEVQYLFRILRLEDENIWGSLRSVHLDFRNPEFDDYEFQFFKSFNQLTSLALDFSNCHKITDEGVNNLASQALKYLTQLTSLALNFSFCKQITNEGANNLASQGLKYLTQLNALTLDFSYCSKITDEGVNQLASQGLKNLTQLTSLTLNFSAWWVLTNEGVNSLASQGLKYLTQLTSLTLNFSFCKEIIDGGVNYLTFQALKYLTQLTALTLNFSSCWKITDEGLNNLASQALKYLTQLTSLTLDFSGIGLITDKEVKNLVPQALKHLVQLTSLTLNFDQCSQITTEGANNLASQVLKYLTQLTLLILNDKVIRGPWQRHENNSRKNGLMRLKFARSNNRPILLVDDSTRFSKDSHSKRPEPSKLFDKIEGVSDYFLSEFMESQWPEMFPTSAFNPFSSHKEVSNFHKKEIDFPLPFVQDLGQISPLPRKADNSSYKITNEKTSTLALQTLKRRTQSTSLTLDFSQYSKITNEGVSILASQALKHQTQLTSLTLNFSNCSEITNEGMNNLASQALKYLTQLTSLTLDFSWCQQITDEGMSNLASQGLKYLTQLTSLTLNFSWCQQITDEGLNNLIYHTMKHFMLLTALTLDFSSCRITEFTAISIAKILRYFGFIQNQD